MKIKLGVFFGGKSVEHEVSVITAIQAMASINKDKYEIVPIYISKNGDMYCGEKIGKIESYTDIPSLLRESSRVVLVKDENKFLLTRYPAKKFGNSTVASIDIAFPMGHGTNVEDGALQGFLQTIGIPYVGCDVTSAAVGMDKYITKILLKADGIPVLNAERLKNSAHYELQSLEEKIGYPMIIKPINLGSSVGIKIARDRDELEAVIEHAFMFTNEIIAEHAIMNLKEVNVAVLGDAEAAVASECEEPIACDEILSYEDKYVSGDKNGSKSSGMASLKRKIPADITPMQREEIRLLAVKAFRSLSCNGVARLDFMIDMDNDEIYFNEINTLPGSLAFYLWEPIGLKYTDMLEKMISLAFKRERENSSINFSFESNILKDAKLGGSKGSKR